MTDREKELEATVEVLKDRMNRLEQENHQLHAAYHEMSLTLAGMMRPVQREIEKRFSEERGVAL